MIKNGKINMEKSETDLADIVDLVSEEQLQYNRHYYELNNNEEESTNYTNEEDSRNYLTNYIQIIENQIRSERIESPIISESLVNRRRSGPTIRFNGHVGKICINSIRDRIKCHKCGLEKSMNYFSNSKLKNFVTL